jgi:hypothetical protein
MNLLKRYAEAVREYASPRKIAKLFFYFTIKAAIK